LEPEVKTVLSHMYVTLSLASVQQNVSVNMKYIIPIENKSKLSNEKNSDF